MSAPSRKAAVKNRPPRRLPQSAMSTHDLGGLVVGASAAFAGSSCGSSSAVGRLVGGKGSPPFIDLQTSLLYSSLGGVLTDICIAAGIGSMECASKLPLPSCSS